MPVSILDHIQHPNFDLSSYSRSNVIVVLDSPYTCTIPYWSLISIIWPNSAALRDISLWYLSDLDIDLSMSLKVKCDIVIGLPIYGFLLVFNSKIWPNSAPLRDIRLWNLSDLDFDLSSSLEVECNGVVEFSLCDGVVEFSLFIYTLHIKVKDIFKFSRCFVLFDELAFILVFFNSDIDKYP